MRTVKKLSLLACLFAGTAFADDSVEYHGYVRAGGGWSEGGTNQTCFQLANTPGYRPFRLGNECDGLYSEHVVSKIMGDPKSDQPWFQAVFNMAITSDLLATWEPTGDGDLTLSLREAYLKGSNLLPNNAALWMGKRFYRRHDLHMFDLFNTENNGGRGVGIEDYQAGDLTLSLALMQYRNGTGLDDSNAPIESSIDFRLAVGNFEGVLLYGSQSSKDSETGEKIYEPISGQSITGIHIGPLAGGENKAFLQYGMGLYARNAGGTNPFFNNPTGTFVPRDGDASVIEDSTSFRFSDQWTKDMSSADVGVGFVFQSDDFGGLTLSSGEDAESSTVIMAGVRGSYYLVESWKGTLELGHASVANNLISSEDATVQEDQAMTKVTVALEAVKEKGFYARPAMRFFVTSAFWDEETQGFTGGRAFHDESGVSYGFQAEWWW